MPSNQTQNYQLSQWVKSDQVKMEDFNADNAKIDGALAEHTAVLAEHAAELAAHAATLTGKGNCQIDVFTYKGTGTCGDSGDTRITFAARPAFFIIFGGAAVMVASRASNTAIVIANETSYSGSTACVHHSISWRNGNQVVLSADNPTGQMNLELTYHVIAFYAKS